MRKRVPAQNNKIHLKTRKMLLSPYREKIIGISTYNNRYRCLKIIDVGVYLIRVRIYKLNYILVSFIATNSVSY